MNIFNNEINEFLDYCKENLIDIYLVGGAIRDYLINNITYDYDFALTSDYNQALSLLEKKYTCKSNDTYQSIKINIGEIDLEITHCRIESEYLDYRHPSKIEFISDIALDSYRRDFTINAIYYKNGEFYDFHNGLDDIKNKRLKVIGDIKERFSEDPLRILRMIRLSCLGFKISKGDKKIINNSAELLHNLSSDSFNSEFDKLLSLNVNIIDDYKKLFQNYFDKQFKHIDKLNNLNTINEKKTYLGIRNNSFLYKYRDIIIRDDFKYLNKLILKLNVEIVKELINYYDKINNTNVIKTYDKIINTSISNIKDLDITSKEIIEIIEIKEETSYYISLVANAIIDGKIKNNKEEIKKYILENKK